MVDNSILHTETEKTIVFVEKSLHTETVGRTITTIFILLTISQ